LTLYKGINMYAKIDNDNIVRYPYTTSQLRNSNKNVSFPFELSNDLLAEFNVVRVIVTGQPDYDAMTETVVEGTPVYSSERNRWEQQWSVVSLSAEDIAQKLASQTSTVRKQRNELLKSTDWTQVDDSPLSNIQKAEWAIYRQALRDVTTQTNFPWSVIWPTEP